MSASYALVYCIPTAMQKVNRQLLENVFKTWIGQNFLVHTPRTKTCHVAQRKSQNQS